MPNKITIRAPKGFRVRYQVNTYDNRIESVYCELVTHPAGEYAGNVELERLNHSTFITHANLRYPYHNKGLGTMLYAKAIAWAFNHGFKVRSSGDSSSMAKRVWEGKGLRKYFNIRKLYVKSNRLIAEETWYPSRKRKSNDQ